MKKELTLALILASCSNEVTIIRSAEVKNSLLNIWDGRVNEQGLCITGRKQNDTLYLEKTFPMPTDSAGEFSLYGKCPDKKEVLADAHTHTNGNCKYSAADSVRLYERKHLEIRYIVCGQGLIGELRR